MDLGDCRPGGQWTWGQQTMELGYNRLGRQQAWGTMDLGTTDDGTWVQQAWETTGLGGQWTWGTTDLGYNGWIPNLNIRHIWWTSDVMHIKVQPSWWCSSLPSPQLSSSRVPDNLLPNLKWPLHTFSSHVMSEATFPRSCWLTYTWQKCCTPWGGGV